MLNHQANYSNFVDILRDRALNQPNQTAYTFLPDGETESGSFTYQSLDRHSRAIAAWLQSRVPVGSRILVVYPYTAGLEFIAAFFGCLYGSMIAVTDNPPRRPQDLAKLQDRVVSAQATVLLTTKELLAHIQRQLAQNPDLGSKLTEMLCLATDEISLDWASEWAEPQLEPDTLAFLQYTSGSTGIPKGVMVTHRNLLHNSAAIYQSFEHTSASRVLMWLPLYHDMGLIGGVMQPLYGGFPVILMSPIALIQKPIRWLQGISCYQITSSGGPNFAYDLLCRKVSPEEREKLDLSSWDVAFCGAEPVRAETLEQFATMFAPCGFRREVFYPCYGMAETTLFISGGLKKQDPLISHVDEAQLWQNRAVVAETQQEGTKAIVGCGRTWLGDRIVIVDPETLTQCEKNQVGEIWVSGTGVGLGYWNKPEETEQTFNAYLKDTGEGPFLRTGDLGFLADGELYITGRLKEVMIFWGRNHYPQHIEQAVEKSHPALRPNCGAAFAVEVEGEERLVIVHEVERTYLRRLATDEIVEAICQTVVQQFATEVYAIELLKTGSLPKTSSGKIQRRTCQKLFLEGNLNAISRWRNHQIAQSNFSDWMSRAEVAAASLGSELGIVDG